MKVLIVCSKNSGKVAPFIDDQVKALEKEGAICDYFTIEGKGIRGYLGNYKTFLKKTKSFQPDLIHAHYGLSGLLANLQRRIPVITTYHGSDINNPKMLAFSRTSILLSAWNIFVSQKNIDIAKVKKNFSLIACGVDLILFQPMDKLAARRSLGFGAEEKLVLFAGSFKNQVKNPTLAIEALKLIPGARLLELKGFTRPQVALIMNAVDVCLMTSHTEGSPQFIKEAMACNCPIVSVEVGDVAKLLEGVENCWVVERKTEQIAKYLQFALSNTHRCKGNKRIKQLSLESTKVAQQIIEIYKNINSKYA
jgi:glycosyltransferase involved in cell wall biosynthesis